MNGSADCQSCSPTATDEEPPGPLDLSSSILSTDLAYAAETISVDATLIRSVLLPAAMKLLGNWNWYLPSWLQWLPDFHVEGGK